jgi:hypothetical protein
MSFESDLELRVGAQDPEQFERMMFDLVQDEHPTANRLQPPDARESRSTPGSGGSARASLIGIRIPPPGSGARYPDTILIRVGFARPRSAQEGTNVAWIDVEDDIRRSLGA